MAKAPSLLTLLSSRFPGKPKKDLYAAVLCGEVRVNDEVVRDPKALVDAGATIAFAVQPYVSRGGRKLERAIDAFRFEVKGRGFLDAGASTGGFTDCLLRRGAAFVHAVDSGHNQLAYRLRRDERVYVREDSPIQSVPSLDPVPDASVADVSFRSLRGVAAHILSLTKSHEGIFLFKPQFEWIDPLSGFDGVVRDEKQVAEILHTGLMDLAAEGVFALQGVQSPIKGREGNREYLLLLSLAPIEDARFEGSIAALVQRLVPVA